jgi:NTE family protein
VEVVVTELITRRSRRRRSPRVGLVLGAGGLLGSAWMTGALAVIADRLDRPLRELDLVLGTSAGAVLGAALRCGMDVPELLAYQRGTDPADLGDKRPDVLPRMRTIDRESGNGFPPVPLPLLGSPRLLAAAAIAPHRMNPLVAASALLPRGRARMTSLVRMVDMLQVRGGATVDGWVHEPLWVVAVDYDAGRRVVFGRAGAPPAPVADAVLASCSIPGWFAPHVLDGRRYVDGGVASATSLALLARPGAPPLDEVYVLAPLASHAYDRPLDPVAMVERRVRRLLTRWLDGEVAAVRAAGPRVIVLTPGPADLQAMGGNLMNPGRRALVMDTARETTATALEKMAPPRSRLTRAGPPQSRGWWASAGAG